MSWQDGEHKETYTDKDMFNARMAKLVDALDLGSSGATHAGSSPALRTK